MEEVNIKKIKRKSIKKRKVNELKNEEGDVAGDGLPTSKESGKKESVGLDMEDKNDGQIDTNLSDRTEFSCSGMRKTGSKHSKASKKKKENELNKSEKLFVSSEAENVEDLKEEVLTELLNDAGKGKLKKVKKTKLKKRKINEGNLNDKIEDDAKKLKGEIEDESKIAVSENDVINSSSSSCHPAIEYLISWKKNKNEWSFKKTRQIWLLKNMYDQTKVSDKNFKILIKYLKDLKGKAREDTLTSARDFMETEDEGEIIDSEKALQRVRAERIVKLLS